MSLNRECLILKERARGWESRLGLGEIERYGDRGERQRYREIERHRDRADNKNPEQSWVALLVRYERVIWDLSITTNLIPLANWSHLIIRKFQQ
jgi:hypothetical protein